MAKLKVEDCEKSDLGKLWVDTADISETLPDGKPDNDFYCRFFGHTALIEVDGQIVCVGPGKNCTWNTML